MEEDIYAKNIVTDPYISNYNSEKKWSELKFGGVLKSMCGDAIYDLSMSCYVFPCGLRIPMTCLCTYEENLISISFVHDVHHIDGHIDNKDGFTILINVQKDYYSVNCQCGEMEK